MTRVWVDVNSGSPERFTVKTANMVVESAWSYYMLLATGIGRLARSLELSIRMMIVITMPMRNGTAHVTRWLDKSSMARTSTATLYRLALRDPR